jgi:hypothetical protein
LGLTGIYAAVKTKGKSYWFRWALWQRPVVFTQRLVFIFCSPGTYRFNWRNFEIPNFTKIAEKLVGYDHDKSGKFKDAATVLDQ